MLKHLIIALFLVISVPVFAQRIDVIDGVTIRIGSEKIRLVGFNTPEKHDAKCQQEALMAAEATDYLRTLVNNRTKQIDIERLKNKDKYRRTLAYLFVDGIDVADIMIGQGLAERYDCPKGRCPKRRDWCVDEVIMGPRVPGPRSKGAMPLSLF